jgi:hypothetical protein
MSPNEDALRTAFEVCRPFKTHLLVERPGTTYAPSKHHRQEIRRAMRRCSVTRVALADSLEDWMTLYGGLIAGRAIAGPAAFSKGYFEALAKDANFVTFVAERDGTAVAMGIWFKYRQVAYNHLAASNTAGYAVGASYALYQSAIDYFCDADVLDLGGAAGVAEDATNGLFRFKRGFSNATMPTWLCGAVLDRAQYDALSAGKTSEFFPAYRG